MCAIVKLIFKRFCKTEKGKVIYMVEVINEKTKEEKKIVEKAKQDKSIGGTTIAHIVEMDYRIEIIQKIMVALICGMEVVILLAIVFTIGQMQKTRANVVHAARIEKSSEFTDLAVDAVENQKEIIESPKQKEIQRQNKVSAIEPKALEEKRKKVSEIVTTRFAEIYKGKSRKTAIDKVRKGAHMDIYGIEGNWLVVKMESGYGYIHRKDTSKVKNYAVVTNCSWVNIRKGPSIKSEIKDSVPVNTAYRVLAEENGWMHVKNLSNKQTGYIFKKYIEVSTKRKAKAEAAKAEVAKAEAAKAEAAKVEVAKVEVAKAKAEAKNNDSKSIIKAYAKTKCQKYGWDSFQFRCLEQLWEHESGWNPNCSYKGCLGIPQMKLSAHGMPSNYSEDYKVQIDWGLKYIKGRYGLPANAWKHFQKHNWY